MSLRFETSLARTSNFDLHSFDSVESKQLDASAGSIGQIDGIDLPSAPAFFAAQSPAPAFVGTSSPANTRGDGLDPVRTPAQWIDIFGGNGRPGVGAAEGGGGAIGVAVTVGGLALLGHWLKGRRPTSSPPPTGNSGGPGATSAPPPQTINPAAPAPGYTHQIDLDFISRLEGGRQTSGYVPRKDNGEIAGQSGVTIATGFDLGARSADDLRKLGLSEDLIKKLAPYLGLKKEEAVAALEMQPLNITPAEAKQIDDGFKRDFINKLMRDYDAATKGTKFANLPPEAQTVIASVSFQYGDPAAKTPMFWDAVTRQDWKKAEEILRNFGDAYPTRRGQEADLLKRMQDRLNAK
jgi:hypothetical protein